MVTRPRHPHDNDEQSFSKTKNVWKSNIQESAVTNTRHPQQQIEANNEKDKKMHRVH